MPRVQYAFRDDEKNISLLVQGTTAAYPLCQIVTLRKREIVPDFLDQFLALDVKGMTCSATALTERGRSIQLTGEHRRCLLKIESQIEFSVKPRVMQRLSEFLPAYTPSALYNFFEGQPYGFLAVLQVFTINESISDTLMAKGRLGSAQIIQLYDNAGEKIFLDVAEPIAPLIDPGLFFYIKDEIVHTLRVENALIGIYENDEEGKRLLQQKRDAYNDASGQFKHTFNEEDDIDRSIVDYDAVYSEVLQIDPSLAPFIDYVSNIKAPQMVEWQMLYPKATSGDMSARTRLVEMYIRNVIRIALYYHRKHGLPIADAIQDGIVGLINAIEKFGHADSNTFQSYYPMWVRQAIQREMPVYMYYRYFPAHIHERLMAISAIAESMDILLPGDYQDFVRLIPELCQKLEMSEAKVKEALGYFQLPIFIDDLSAEDDATLPSALVAPDMALAVVLEKERSTVVRQCIERLTPREAEVLISRYGLTGDTPQTLEEIGTHFGVTRERIRQIEAKAMKKLTQPTILHKLEGYQ